MTKSSVIRWVALIAAAALSTGCGRGLYLTPSHGISYSKAIKLQVVNREYKPEDAEGLGLDALEAAVIAGAYRKSLDPLSQTREETSSVLYVDQGMERDRYK